ncbi:MAG: PPC domain-containing protein, partial [Planctomycetia bacterium]|nr:PPC domain-containing protein [Planctomycetia bacterium]
MRYRYMIWAIVAGVASQLALLASSAVSAEPPAPLFDIVFPAGARAGESTIVTVAGRHLESLRELHSNAAGFRSESIEPGKFRLTFPAETTPGVYDLWAVSERGVSSPRTFFVGNREEHLEAEPNDLLQSPGAVPLDVTVNGRIEKGGDLDHFRFEARRGQRIVIECQAHRIDSRLRAVLELFDSNGKRLAVNRGYFGIDPLIDFRVPADGAYVVKVQDLISSGSAEHYYRLDIDTGSRVAFAVPSVVQRGKSSRVRLYGWNLAGAGQTQSPSTRPDAIPLDHVDVDVTEALARVSWPLPVRLQPAQAVFVGFGYHLPASHASVALGVTDVPVVLDRSDNHTPASAQLISHPCEVSGQLVAGDECHWFAIQAKRGEVLYLEALGQRINSPVDLQLSVLDAAGER